MTVSLRRWPMRIFGFFWRLLDAGRRVVWKREEISDTIAVPVKQSSPSTHPVEWLVGEALTNLYVGLGRYRRNGMRCAAHTSANDRFRN